MCSLRGSSRRAHFQLAALAAIFGVVAGCGSDNVEQEVIAGQVIDGYVAGGLVCLDQNGNERCDESDSQALTDSTGRYRLWIPKDSTGPLLAEVKAGTSVDLDQPERAVDASYRMASPSRGYSTNITPFTTLVHLSKERNFLLAEDMVRNLLGLPPKFDIALTTPPEAGSLTRAVSTSVVAALKATAGTVDFSAPGALDAVVAAFPAALTDMPQLRIATKDHAPIVSKEVYVSATFLLTNPVVSSEPVALNGRIRGRGHSTWGQPKNPYKVQITNDASYAAIADVLGMKKNRNWALLADFFDRSLMRNKLAFAVGNSSVFAEGLKWTPAGQHVEVYLNDDYVGVYLLTEDIRIDPARLNIKKMSSDPTVNDLDGGYIVEVDHRLDCYAGADVNLQLVTPHSVAICVDTPDESAITPNQLSFIKNLLVQAEQDIYGPNRLDRINAASFIDWYLLQELFRNNDAVFFSSDFMWKDSEAATNPVDRLLNMGPIWDFDLSAGNINWNNNWLVEGCWVSRSPWFVRLFDNEAFLASTMARWKQKRPALERFINSSVDTYSRRLDGAQQRNFARWPIFGTSMTNYYVFQNHEEEVTFLRNFLVQRMAWLDRAYESTDTFKSMCK